jgi:ATP-dependent exoDNAse (exonuclease V) alpha subunit
MNKQTKAYKKAGFARKVVKGASSDKKNQNGGLAIDIEVETFKGRPCLTDFKDKAKNPMNRRRSPKVYKKPGERKPRD